MASIFLFFYFAANVPQDVVQKLPEELQTGVYFGWASVENCDVHKAVLSIGWNPFYDNKEKSMVCDYNFYLLCEPSIIRHDGKQFIIT